MVFLIYIEKKEEADVTNKKKTDEKVGIEE